MLQTYQGYLEQGCFTPAEAVVMPERARVLITLLESELIPPIKTKSQRQLEAVQAFIADTSGDGELSEEDFAELESGKYKFRMRMKPLEL